MVVVSEQRDELIWKIPGKAAGKASNCAKAQKPAQTYVVFCCSGVVVVVVIVVGHPRVVLVAVPGEMVATVATSTNRLQ